jgi:hypothetical protein
MATTGWVNEITGRRLDTDELRRLQARARRLYAANMHIFEDERDALSALGVVPLSEVAGTVGAAEHPFPPFVAA